MKNRLRINSLTFVRFIAAVIVINFHYGTELTKRIPALTCGPKMVTFFFVLSGFVMSVAYYSKEKIELKDFYLARFFRIYPLYIISIILMVFIKIIQNNKINIISLFQSIFLIQSWSLNTKSLSINFAAWAISVEVLFYFLFPFLIIKMKKEKIKIWMILVIWVIIQIISIILFNKDNSKYNFFIFYFPIMQLCSFLIGMWAGIKRVKNDFKFTNINQKINAILFVILTIGLIALLNISGDKVRILKLNIPLNTSFFAPIFVIFIFALSIQKNIFSKILENKKLLFLGELSYGIYILQAPVYVVVYWLLKNKLDSNVFFLIYILIIVIISIIGLWFLERPLVNYYKKIKKGKK